MTAGLPHPSLGALEPIGPGRLVLVVGPSGAGKDTVLVGAKAAFGQDPGVVFPRRVVTRPASGHEDHDSLEGEAFDRAVTAGAFAFWWQAHGLKYAIPRSAEDDVRAGRTIVCNVSRAIVADVRTRYVHVEAVLVTAPADVLAARLAGRSRETDGVLAQRLGRNDAFTEFGADHVIENAGAAELAVQQLVGVIASTTAAGQRR